MRKVSSTDAVVDTAVMIAMSCTLPKFLMMMPLSRNESVRPLLVLIVHLHVHAVQTEHGKPIQD